VVRRDPSITRCEGTRGPLPQREWSLYLTESCEDILSHNFSCRGPLTESGCVQVTAKERRFTEEQVRAYIEAGSRRPEEVRIDTPRTRRVSSEPEKGGERSFGVSKAGLRKEMSQWR
jgi:hypothetical protein